MKRYEGLFILEAVAKEEETKDIIDKIQKDIEQAGGRVDKVQRMGQRPFARNTLQHGAGYYVNLVFDAPPKAIAELDAKFHLEAQIFRWQITEHVPEPPPRKGKEAAESVGKRE